VNQAIEVTTANSNARAAGAAPPVSADAGSSDRVAALCERVRQLAEATAADVLESARRQAAAQIAAATARAEAAFQAKLADARQRLEKQLNRDLQNARLAARGRLDAFRWDTLSGVLEEAQRAVERLRAEDPQRYYAALVRFVRSARDELAGEPIVVQAGVADVQPLRDRLADAAIEVVEADITGGVIAGTLDGNVVVDQTIARRRQQLDTTLRLAAREILFEEFV
jgi:vacuolar-type H+-ATPase subunit E/Vma4